MEITNEKTQTTLAEIREAKTALENTITEMIEGFKSKYGVGLMCNVKSEYEGGESHHKFDCTITI